MGKHKTAELATVIGRIMEEYEDEIISDVQEVTAKVGKAGAQEMRAVSREKFGTSDRAKPYSRGWNYENTGTRVHVAATVWNKTNPGLVHLLENGHAVRRGGRIVGEAKAYPHVKAVNDTIQESYVKEVENAIRGS